jgi:NAD(P)-dependent dehydrogenase (short-subunit alcohol dehydrogenase family)
MWTTENCHRYDRGARAARWLIAVHPLLEARGRRRIDADRRCQPPMVICWLIVNLSSIAGVTGSSRTHMGYNASKGAVRTLTKSIAVQFGADGILANSVHPGLMPPMRTSGKTADPVVCAKVLESVRRGRAGEVDEVANAVLFLASDEVSYITGAELYVDGGYLAT